MHRLTLRFLSLLPCVLALHMLPKSSHAQCVVAPFDPNEPNTARLLGPTFHDPNYSCPTTGFVSRCWAGTWNPPEGRQPPGDYWPYFGFPLKINLRDALAVPDLPPLSHDILASTSPLAPATANHTISPSTAPVRQTAEGVVDLVTGSPLLQVTDFALPFGSAVFRHTRTYGYPVGTSVRRSDWAEGVEQISNENDHMWDWNGLNWMMSESPILLIDASYEGLGAQDTDQISYLIPDAHHSIPFVKQPDDSYAAPSWCEARMYADGPDHYVVERFRGEIQYRFKVHHMEDLWWYVPNQNQFSDVELPGAYKSVHAADGLGFPQYATIESITDRNGNAIVYHYCDFTQTEETAGNGCKECWQNCNEKGQIRAIELKDPTGNTIWTLLYSYRGFAFPTGVASAYENGLFPVAGNGQAVSPRHAFHTLHSIHAYRGGNMPQAGAQPCRTIAASRFMNIESFDEYDLVEPNVPSGWEVAVDYLYEEAGVRQYKSHPGPPPTEECPTVPPGTLSVPSGDRPDPDTPYDLAWEQASVNPRDGGGKLLKATVSRRDGAGTLLGENLTVYRYEPHAPADFGFEICTPPRRN